MNHSSRVVGLVGLGLVGSALGRRLLAAGFDVLGYDVDAARREAFAAAGGRAAESLAAIGAKCERVLLALYDTATVEQVLEGSDGMLGARHQAILIVDCGTGDPDRRAGLALRLVAHGATLVEAPLSGSSAQIAAGEALCFVGGEPGAVERAADLLDAIAARRHHVGAVGMAARAKLATNLVLGLNRAALAEGLVFAEALGLPGKTFIDLLRDSPAYSRAVDAKAGKMLAGDFAPQARLEQHARDVGLMLEHAAALGQVLPMTEAHARLLADAIAAGDGDLDNSAVIVQIRRYRTHVARSSGA
ncbi:MAG TPA: NAD(P)-dependent oxidoreductase [Burkholderiales bacterium]|nr:NAD(P)-dependent oxidoreductase [Burkholderiales bacterium]